MRSTLNKLYDFCVWWKGNTKLENKHSFSIKFESNGHVEF